MTSLHHTQAELDAINNCVKQTTNRVFQILHLNSSQRTTYTRVRSIVEAIFDAEASVRDRLEAAEKARDTHYDSATRLREEKTQLEAELEQAKRDIARLKEKDALDFCRIELPPFPPRSP